MYKIDDFVDDSLNLNIDLAMSLNEFRQLKNTPHSIKWHQEGDPVNHTLLACEKLRWLLEKEGYTLNHSIADCKVMMCAMLMHDLGKATTTKYDKEKEDYACVNHGAVGSRIARNLLRGETDIELRERVCRLVRWHMSLHHILEKPLPNIDATMKRLSLGYVEDSFFEQWLITFADALGSINSESDEFVFEKFNKIKTLAIEKQCFEHPWVTFNNETLECVNCCPIVNILIGLPGSGKDTFLDKLMLSEPFHVLSRDEIRKEIGLKGSKPQGNKKEEEKVTQIFNKRLSDLLKDNRNTIYINNTNLLQKYRKGFEELCSHGCDDFVLNYIYIEASGDPVNACIVRRMGEIQPNIIEHMWDTFDFPDPSECNSLILIKQK